MPPATTDDASGRSLPDIGRLGPYTYLVTELLWGAVAVMLLRYANAFRAAGRVVAVVYLPAYLWDRYTLAVGVFEIPLRTGIEVFDVPIEEHLFMLLVPSFVVGVHESIEKILADNGTPSSASDADD
ncbi:lycopene cyclase domain-containing protein [Halorientalis pallida]|uniref:Lycopene cyclase domain-containing protein n=1 Tax=Halorientalis pallida TaxID=2479928 RepID=A0A498KWS6_9EURY|nr:lycopene cyclase domain-containing protein [Halorientalis pallida]RXK46189.1 lycopene cyclase domain-containing protein [Halorientalis pallida]